MRYWLLSRDLTHKSYAVWRRLFCTLWRTHCRRMRQVLNNLPTKGLLAKTAHDVCVRPYTTIVSTVFLLFDTLWNNLPTKGLLAKTAHDLTHKTAYNLKQICPPPPHVRSLSPVRSLSLYFPPFFSLSPPTSPPFRTKWKCSRPCSKKKRKRKKIKRARRKRKARTKNQRSSPLHIYVYIYIHTYIYICICIYPPWMWLCACVHALGVRFFLVFANAFTHFTSALQYSCQYKYTLFYL